jgi:hypothetical protein
LSPSVHLRPRLLDAAGLPHRQPRLWAAAHTAAAQRGQRARAGQVTRAGHRPRRAIPRASRCRTAHPDGGHKHRPARPSRSRLPAPRQRAPTRPGHARGPAAGSEPRSPTDQAAAVNALCTATSSSRHSLLAAGPSRTTGGSPTARSRASRTSHRRHPAVGVAPPSLEKPGITDAISLDDHAAVRTPPG